MSKVLLGVILGSMIILSAACSGLSGASSGGDTTEKKLSGSYAPHIAPADFSTRIDNEYFPLRPGTSFVYEGKTEDAPEGDTVTVTRKTKNVMGVECVIVEDSVTEDGKLTEKTNDWYAQDAKGNVWYFGEDTKEYEDGKVKSTEGSWEAGKDGAKPGVIMPADPKVGEVYRQEYYEGEAEDMARPLQLGGSVRVPYGSFDHVLVTDEWTPLEKNVAEHKFYAPGVGNVKEVATRGPRETLTLVEVKRR